MPIMDGLSALKEIRANKALGTLAVIMLTTSDSPNDINDSYSAGANAYITQATDENDFVEAAKKIEGFWFQWVLLPNQKTKHILK